MSDYRKFQAETGNRGLFLRTPFTGAARPKSPRPHGPADQPDQVGRPPVGAGWFDARKAIHRHVRRHARRYCYQFRGASGAGLERDRSLSSPPGSGTGAGIRALPWDGPEIRAVELGISGAADRGAGDVIRGIFSRSMVEHGSSGLAGEFGYVVVDPSGRQCWCGRRDCVETRLGLAGLYERCSNRDGYGNLAALAAERGRMTPGTTPTSQLISTPDQVLSTWRNGHSGGDPD